MNESYNSEIIVSIISAIVTISIAVWTFFRTRKSQIEIEKIKSKLAQKESLNNARIDYEFQAKKRLYEEYEPLFFQLIENSRNAYYKILNLARDERNGVLIEGGWTKEYNYYVKNTIYKLLAPSALFKIMQKKLTFVDLNVDSRIEAQYTLAKYIYFLFTEDFRLALSGEKLDYDPNNKDWRNLINTNSSKYSRQGFPIGILDKTIDCLIVKENINNETKERLCTYGEFEEILENEKKKTEVARNMFIDFSPSSRPVLWRILVAQSVAYKILVDSYNDKDITLNILIKNFNNFKLENEQNFNLGEGNDGEKINVVLAAVKSYLTGNINEFFNPKL